MADRLGGRTGAGLAPARSDPMRARRGCPRLAAWLGGRAGASPWWWAGRPSSCASVAHLPSTRGGPSTRGRVRHHTRGGERATLERLGRRRRSSSPCRHSRASSSSPSSGPRRRRRTPPSDRGRRVAATPSRLDAGAGLSLDPASRVRHARGQSLPDAIALHRSPVGRVPTRSRAARQRRRRGPAGPGPASRAGRVLPFGGGTCVVGGVTPGDDERSVVTVDLGRPGRPPPPRPGPGWPRSGPGRSARTSRRRSALRGSTLGHFPQSFEFSTVGGWVATRSAGLDRWATGGSRTCIAGGRVETPVGPLTLPPFPAAPPARTGARGSSARRDGSACITDVSLRVVPTSAAPRRAGVQPARLGARPRGDTRLARAGLPLQLVRVATPTETASTTRSRRSTAPGVAGPLPALARSRPGGMPAPGGHRRLDGRPPCRRGRGRSPREARARRRCAPASARRGGVTGSVARTCATRCGTLATRPTRSRRRSTGPACRPWPPRLTPGLRRGLEADGERVHAFSHLSHVYPTGSSLYVTYLYRLSPDPDETLDRWRRLKTLASETIVAHGGTISHQHGVGPGPRAVPRRRGR